MVACGTKTGKIVLVKVRQPEIANKKSKHEAFKFLLQSSNGGEDSKSDGGHMSTGPRRKSHDDGPGHGHGHFFSRRATEIMGKTAKRASLGKGRHINSPASGGGMSDKDVDAAFFTAHDKS
jgi:hypothetical protein